MNDCAVVELAVVEPATAHVKAKVDSLLIVSTIVEPAKIKPTMVDAAGVLATTTGNAIVQPEMVDTTRVDAAAYESPKVHDDRIRRDRSSDG